MIWFVSCIDSNIDWDQHIYPHHVYIRINIWWGGLPSPYLSKPNLLVALRPIGKKGVCYPEFAHKSYHLQLMSFHLFLGGCIADCAG